MDRQLRFDGRVAVITGAGGGLGRAHALLLGSRGAKVVVNDLGGGFNGDGSAKPSMADEVVREIRAAGGTAVADYNSVADGDKIIETAVKAFGSVHILINNAGILRDVSFRKMTDKDWDLVQHVHMFGTFKTTRAAWPIMKRQRFGRIVTTASGAGTYGNFGQTNYCAAKAGIMGFTFSLAQEGAEHNITANVLAPIAASRLTQTVMSEELLSQLRPEYVATIIPVLTHVDSKETGSLFELGGGCINKFRWERSQGLQADSGLTRGQLLQRWSKVSNFNHATYGRAQASGASSQGVQGRAVVDQACQGMIAIVIGASTSMGQHVSRGLAASGATVVLAGTSSRELSALKEALDGIGGEAKIMAQQHAAEAGTVTLKALEAHGRVDIIAFCGPERQALALEDIDDATWTATYDHHVREAYKAIQPVWASMIKNKYGRILLGTSEDGLYGAKQGSAYSAATYGVVGFMRALFREGQKYNIRVNALSSEESPPPSSSKGSSSATGAAAACLCSDDLAAENTGRIVAVKGGRVSRVRWQRSHGAAFALDSHSFSPEAVADRWGEIVTFDNRADYPDSAADGMGRMLSHMGQGKAYAPKQAPKGGQSKL